MNKLLTNFPVALTEEQKNVLKLTLSAVLQDDPITKYWRPTVYENGDIMWALVASESEPTSQNIKGPSGFTPQFQIDQSTAEWQVTYDGTNWTPLGIIASGAQGPQGNPGQNGTNGTNGTDGTSVYLKSVTDAQGGKQVTLGWGTSDTSAFVIPSGAAGTPGTNGTDGVSPTVTTSEIGPTTEHPQGGTSVTITDKTGPNQFNVWNGINGQGATVNLLEGTGIKITENGTNYTIGVSANYALKTELPDVSDMATKTWVGDQGFLKATDLTDYATKTYANDASAYALSQAESWVGQQNFATSAGLDANKQFAMTTSGWKEVQGGGSTYTPGDCIDITNNVISFDGVVVDAAEQIIAGNGTTENPLSTSSFANALNIELVNINDAISDLADEVAALGGTIVLRGRASCQWLQNIQPSDYQTGDAYIATDSGQISSYNHETGQWDNINVSTGDMVVLINYNNQREVAVLSTTPDLDIYAQKTELPIVEAGANVVVTETTMSTGAKKYTVASLGGGGSSDMAYLVNSNDPRISVTQTYTPSPECKTFTLSANMPHFEAVTAMPSTITPNTYYFVYEE